MVPDRLQHASVPGLLTGEGGRKLAGMDLSRSFCRAPMKGSFKCSEGEKGREEKVHAVDHPHGSVVVSECTFIKASV